VRHGNPATRARDVSQPSRRELFQTGCTLRERLHLLARAAQDQRVAALETHDFSTALASATSRLLISNWVATVVARRASHEMWPRRSGQAASRFTINQVVADHGLGRLQKLQPPDRDRSGAPGTANHEQTKPEKDVLV